MDFNEITDTIKGKLYERIGNTFLFSYSIFFISTNWIFLFQIINSYPIKTIIQSKQEYPIDFITPICYAALYSLLMPLIVLITESYNELARTGTLKIRNSMRKKWQEVELTTIQAIENKYINKINHLQTTIANDESQFASLSANLLNWFRQKEKLTENTNVIFVKCAENLSVGDVAVNVNGLASRFTSSDYPVLGIVVNKPTSSHSFIINRGEVPLETCDISQYQNINKNGTYVLSSRFPGRLEILSENDKGKYLKVGKKEAEKFIIELQNLQLT
ncbi:hypothetical protein LEP1GSC195_1455 [Leptospira wolbachii serovar Codice str. CDC]|uniref:Uncharacterized protein n=1 Tax=Leptospira wolbachii serovar Codice str. CDC TaxID=1218599 RepID=R9ACB1_9LEPT|nr:hypothetical protein [Leptospira wolbachii]EOQ97810.1 hypothetical protein LEP1GSC195_1455 [Leptospira wolbachii serovar Codice str. CDC]